MSRKIIFEAFSLFQINLSVVIQNSGTHMENTILASFTSTLIGFVIMNNRNNEAAARKYLKDGKFRDMVSVLMQYYEFLNLTVSVSQIFLINY